ncbi:MAG: exodeoxyribonuclease V subunit alpha [Candidatus Sedimenticola sp. PURPLELP]
MRELETLLTALNEQRVLTELDLQFARFICRISGESTPKLGIAAALASSSTMSGHVCLDLDDWCGRVITAGEGQVKTRLPAKSSWMRALHATSVVGRPGEYRPLVLDEKGRLYLYRYWDYERQLAHDLLDRAGRAVTGLNERRLRQGLDELFSRSADTPDVDWQKVAAAVAAQRGLSVISGGPGTGKTTTVVRILALLVAQYDTPPAIALAAPTGKAAARLQGSIRKAKQGLGLDQSVLDAIPEHAQTLHRLLGGGHNTVQFRHNRENPLPLDLLILDEASMVDLALMSKLLQALPEKARLILLGDRNQLASVEAGAVLGDICGSWTGLSQGFRQQIERTTGEQLSAEAGHAGPLSDSIVVLRHSYRFGGNSGIGRLADAVNRGDAQQALQLLGSEDYDDIQMQSEHLLESAASGYREYLNAVSSGADEGVICDTFDRFRVLCATRQGEQGVAALNESICRYLEQKGMVRAERTWYPGRPILITRNDYNLHLYNGDIGITLAQADGSLRVCFRSAEGKVRRFSPSRLPEHETVFAMTVHKSQGSEFQRVLLALPRRDTPVLTRELVYTGLTRAGKSIEINTIQSIFEVSVERKLSRVSGLNERFWEKFSSDSHQFSLPGMDE